MHENKKKWVIKGYEYVAMRSISSLNVETLARQVGTSKSSFYHYFADLSIFTEQLMQYHLEQSVIIAQKEKMALSINPDLIEILIDHRIDLLFSKHLRASTNNKAYQKTLAKSTAIIGNELINLWLKDTQLKLTFNQAEAFMELAMGNFFLAINADNINKIWLTKHFEHLYALGKNFESKLYGIG